MSYGQNAVVREMYPFEEKEGQCQAQAVCPDYAAQEASLIMALSNYL